MSMIRWQPFGDMERSMDRMLSGSGWRMPRMFEGEERRFEWQPSADISETEKEFLIRAELPAVDKEDVKVTIADGLITIAGERRFEREDKKEKFHRVESFHGTFERSFVLPANIDEKNIVAESRNGILTVHLPKVEVAATPKPLQVEVH
jgi:HSP20 family protein